MIGVITAVLCGVSLWAAAVQGRMSELSKAAIESCSDAVNLAVSLCGTMALWSGLMQIARRSGMIHLFSRSLQPVLRHIFKGCSPKAMEYITMNLSANMLGISNAATPMGLQAVKEMDRQNGKYTPRCIAMLTVLNTASIQLLPATIGSLRAAHGAKSPLDISVPILFVSLVSAAAGCAVVYVLSLGRKNT